MILEETETICDDASNAIQTRHHRRYHDASANQTVPLGSSTVTSKARGTRAAAYPDAVGTGFASHGGIK